MRRFSEMNPAAIMLYYAAVISVSMFGMRPTLIVTALLSSILYCCLYSGVRPRTHLWYAVLFVVLTVINPIISHNGATVLFYLNSRPFTLEATLYGAAAAGMVVATLYRLRALISDITAEKLMYVFGRLSPKLALLLSVSLRYVALFRTRWRRISDTQKALGLYKDGNIIDTVRGNMRVLSILITWSLENGIITAQSMEARGYSERRRSSYAIYRFRCADLILILLTAAGVALTAVGAAYSPFSFYPAISGELFNTAGIAGSIAYALLCALPIIINVKEDIKWRCLQSRA